MIDVRSCRCARGEDFSGMNQRAGMCRRQAYSQQRGVRQHAVGHTKRAVDQLCDEPHGEQKPPDVHRITSGDEGNSTSFRSMFAVTACRLTADVRFGSRLCENSDVELSSRRFVSITLNKKRTAL